VRSETRAEISACWAKLVPGGKDLGCGWLEDKFGVYWQIGPVK
jgi:predicted 3-demethylubiquinone-9 3-methyltransferase (glyoxalase superfamily)